MSKEELVKIQTWVLKVNIHCDGCKQKVKKILQKIDGVYKMAIDAEHGKVTVSGNVDAATLIKKLAKSGKHAELCAAPKAPNNQNQLNNQLKNMQLDNGKGNKNNKNNGQPQKGGNNQPHLQPQLQPQAKAGMPTPQQLHQLQQLTPQQLQQLTPQQLQQLQQLKNNMQGLGKSPQMKSPYKTGKLELSDDDEGSSDFDDEFDEDDEFEDDFDDLPVSKGPKNGMMAGQNPQMMNAMTAGKGLGLPGPGAPNGGANAGGNKKGAVSIPVQMNGNGGGKGGGNPNAGGQKNGAKNVSGPAGDGKMKNGAGGGNGGGNGGMKGAPPQNGFPNMGSAPGGMGNGSMGGHMGGIPVGQMGGGASMPMAHMNMPAVQGLPAGGGGYNGAGPEMMSGNPYPQLTQQQMMQHQHQQQMMAAMANQQRANANPNPNANFQHMMYARPPPATNYLAPHPYPNPYGYPYGYPPPPPNDGYSHLFSDENTGSCSVM